MKFLNSNRGRAYLFFLTFLFFSLSLVSAATDTQDVDDTFKIDTFVNYVKPCINNGTYCSRSASCNFTVFKPDNSILVNNSDADNNFNYHNVSFTVDTLGIHKVDMTCIDGSLNGFETFYFEVTGSGFNETIWFFVIVAGISFGIILLGFKLLDAWIVILGTFGLYFLGIYTILNGIAGIKDFITTWAVGIIILAVAGYISIKSGIELMNE